MSTITVYVPRDTAAIAMGAHQVAEQLAAQAKARGLDVQIVRNGSRGLLWLEPMIEVQTAEGRVAYGPVQTEDLPGLFDADFLQGGAHTLCHGLTDAIPYLKDQERLTFARVGIIDPVSVADYQSCGGFEGSE